MSKGVQNSILILIILLIGSLFFSGMSVYQKDKALEEIDNLSLQLTETEKKVLQGEEKVKTLKQNVITLKIDKGSLEKEKINIEARVKSAEKEAKEISKEIDSVKRERDSWKRQLEGLRAERDKLEAKLQKTAEPKIIYKEKIVYKERAPDPKTSFVEKLPQKIEIVMPETDQDDEYWAEVLKEKAELEIEVNQLRKELSNNSIEIIGLTQSNTDLKIELDNIQRDGEVVNQSIKSIKEGYARDLAVLREDLQKVKETKGALINNLSLELARTKNDTKFVKNRSERIFVENKELRTQLQQLVSTKGELEKTIIRLKQDKVQIEKQLEEREGMIQTKIHEIWQIKESLDDTFSETQLMMEEKKEESSSGVDLKPIRIVSNDGAKEKVVAAKIAPTYHGKVISVNKENNFVIVDIGEDSGITLGESLGVYRKSEQIASLEIIQIRKDISAADVKEMKEEILQGDTVR